MLLIIFVVLVALALCGGFWGSPRWGAVGWSPLGIVLLLVLVFYFTGHLRFR